MNIEFTYENGKEKRPFNQVIYLENNNPKKGTLTKAKQPDLLKIFELFIRTLWRAYLKMC